MVQFWIRIRILHEKCYIKLGSNRFFIDFRKIDFLEIQYFGIFRLPSYISAYFDDTMQRALKKHVRGLIFIIFGWSLVLTFAKMTPTWASWAQIGFQIARKSRPQLIILLMI